jgi:hypothetical protein
MIVFSISSKKNNVKGIVVNAYGMYGDHSTSKIVALLHKKISKSCLSKETNSSNH